MARPDEEELTKRRARFTPYALLSPGMLWLTLFFLVPLLTLARMSLSTKTSRFDFEPDFTWDFGVYTDAISTYSSQFVRSFVYAGAATVLCILIGYPVAYVIAVRGGRYRNLLLGLVVVPFFIMMGSFAASAGITTDLYRMAKAWLGHLPGGLAIATTWGTALWSAISGSSTATDAKFTMQPRVLARALIAARETRKAVLTLMAISRSKSPSPMFSMGP